MASFAIVRADGTVDKALDGASVADISARYGAPGNGKIEPWDEGEHGSKLASTFQSPDDQLAAWKAVAEAEGQNDPNSVVNGGAVAAAPSANDVAVTVLTATLSRDQLDDLAARKGVEGTFATKADVAAAIVAATTED